jgi:hypothetical protein
VFRGLNETEIDHIMQSFAFKNCLPRQELVNLLRRKLYNRDHHIERKG